jgi:hypothetical protein
MPAGDRPHRLHPPVPTHMVSLADLTSDALPGWSTPPSRWLIADVNPGTPGDANAPSTYEMDRNRLSFPHRMTDYW